jgi:hypothetical protein
MRPVLSVLTNPLPVGKNFLPETIHRVARSFKYRLKTRSFDSHPRYRGHFAVTRSLVEGLQKINANFNYNPNSLSELGDIALVLAGVRTLRQAIHLKQKGKIRKLFAGPNIVSFSTDFNSIIASPEIDNVITPCEWVIEHYVQDNTSLRKRILSWPAGVDMHYWAPSSTNNRDRILFFEKQNTGVVGPIKPYAEYLQNLGWSVDTLRYGSFQHQDYRDLLQRSCLMVGFANSESQGIAWAEAWAADVPTLLWRNDYDVINGRLLKTSTAPYLCKENGLFFSDLEDFKKKVSYWQSNREEFTPRAWTLNNMSDEVCARKIYSRVMSC